MILATLASYPVTQGLSHAHMLFNFCLVFSCYSVSCQDQPEEPGRVGENAFLSNVSIFTLEQGDFSEKTAIQILSLDGKDKPIEFSGLEPINPT